MAVIGNDYALQIGLELNPDSIAQVESQIRAVLGRNMPGLKIVANADQAVNALRSVTANAEEMSSAITAAMEETRRAFLEQAVAVNQLGTKFRENTVSVEQQLQAENDIISQKLSEQRSIIQQSDASIKSQNEAMLASWQSRTVSVDDQLQAENDIIAEKLAEQRAIIQASVDRNNAVLSEIGSRPSVAIQQGSLEYGAYADSIGAATVAQEKMNVAQKEFLASSGQMHHLIASIGNMATWAVGGAVIFGGGAAALKGFQDAIHSQQEQVVQGFYYGEAGKNFTPQMSQQTMRAAIDLSRKYGDEVVRTQEAIGLWAKVTNGELLPSIEMANQALKLNSVTGMSNEEIFRSTIAVLSQYHLALSRANDLYNIGIGLAGKYGGGVKMIGGEAQDAARQMIEGMDKSAAVTASFGLSMEQSAAAVATLIHTGNYDSGSSAGQKLSQALSALERGAPGKAMAELGISLHKNRNLLNELFADWNKEVPQMGNTLGDILSAHASSFAMEPLKLLFNQVGLVKKATEEAYAYEKSHPLQGLYLKMRETDSYKLQQLRASFEAIAITIGRQFLPAITTATDDFEKMVPSLIAAGPAIAQFVSGIASVGAFIGAIEVIKLLGRGAMTLGTQWTTAAAAINASSTAISTSAAASAISLSAEEKAAIGALTENGVVTQEMANEWKTLAASYGISVSDMIGEIEALKAASAEGAASIVVSDESIAASMASLSTDVGLDSTLVEEHFAQMAAAADTSAEAMKTAFASVLPVIGQLLVGGFIAFQVANDIANKAISVNNAQIVRDQYNPAQRHKDESHYLRQMHSADSIITNLRGELAHGGTTIGGFRESSAAIASSLNSEIAFRAKMAADYHAIQNGPINPAEQMAAIKKHVESILRRDHPVPRGITDTGHPALPKSKTAATDYGNAMAATHSAVSQYMNEIAQREQIVSLVSSEIDRLKTLISIKGESLTLSNRLIAADRAEATALQAKAVVLERERNAYLAAESHAKTMASHYGVGTKEHNAWIAQSSTDAFKVQELSNQIANLGIATMKARDAALAAGFAYKDFLAKTGFSADKTTWKSATENFKTGAGGIGGLESASAQVSQNIHQYISTLKKGDPLIQEMKQYLKEMGSTIDEDTTKVQRFITATDSAATSGIRSNALQLHSAGLQTWVRSYDRAIASIDDKWSAFEQKFKVMMENAQGDPKLLSQLQAAQALEYQWIQTSKAVALYNEKVSEAKASISYSVITAGMNSVGNAISSYLTNPSTLNDPNNNQIAALDAQLGNISYTRSMIDSGPYAKYHRMQSLQLEQQAKVIQQEIQHLRQIEAHPPLVKKVFQDMEKALVDGFIKKFEQSFQNQIIKQFIGEQKTVQTPQITATQQNTVALRQLTSALSHGGSGGTGGGASLGGGGSFGGLGSFGGSGVSSGGGFGAAIGAIGALSAGGSGGSGAAGSAIGGALSAIGAIGGGLGSSSGSGSISSGLSAGMSGIGSSAGLMGAGGVAGGAVTNPMVGGALGGISNSATSVYGNHNEFNPGGYSPGTSGPVSGLAKGHTLAGGMQALGGFAMAQQGYQQGGLKGSIMAGLGAYETVVGLGSMLGASGGFAAALGGPIGIAAAAIMFGLSLFHPHYSPSANPDMYANDGYAQAMANAQGSMYTQANGTVYEDSGLKQQLGGMTELQYLTQWYNQYPGGTGLDSDAMTLWNEIGTLTGNGKGTTIPAATKGGNIFIGDSNGHQVGESGNWQNVLQDVGNYTQDLYTLLTANQSLSTPIISMNAYGGSGQNPGFNLWSSPGLSQSEMGAIASAPYGAQAAALGVPSGAGIGATPTSGMGGYPNAPGTASVSIGDQQMQFVNQLNVDGAVLAQIVNAYNNQRQTAGYTRGT